MERLVGVGASPGIAIGVAHVLASRVDIHERRIAADQVEPRSQRFEQALLDTDDAAGPHPDPAGGDARGTSTSTGSSRRTG